MALLRVLLELKDALGLREVIAAHLDHALRPDSAADVAFVREWAGRWDVPFVTERLDWAARGGVPSSNREAAAREARYDFLLRVASGRGAVPAVGHQATDRLETFLAQLLRGAGPRGLSLPRPRREDGLIRPLLDQTAAEVRTFLAERHIPWREDPTNHDRSNLRGRLRAEVLPLLRRESPELEHTVGRTADVLAAVDAHLEAVAAPLLAQLALPAAPGEIALDGSRGRPYDAIILATVLRSAARRLGGNPAEIGFDTIDSSVRAWREGRRLAVDVAGGLRISVAPDRVSVGRTPPAQPTPSLPDRVVPVPGSLSLPEIGAHLTVVEAAGPPAGPARESGHRIAWVDAESLSGELHLRSRRPGDRYRPLGLEGSAKVQDLLVDRKIPRAIRGVLPVLVDGSGIVWIPGFRVDARARITEETKRVLRLELTGGRPFFEET